jgi:hypothetical protein
VRFCAGWAGLRGLVPASKAFQRALKQAGFFPLSCVVPGAGHYWLSDPIDEPGSHAGVFAPQLDLHRWVARFLAAKNAIHIDRRTVPSEVVAIGDKAAVNDEVAWPTDRR